MTNTGFGRAIFLVLTITSVAAAQNTGSPREKIAALRPCVVKVVGEGIMGTGFVVSSDGYILTALHVVRTTKVEKDKATVDYFDRIEVVLSDGRTIEAKAVANPDTQSPLYDIALLKAEVVSPCSVKVGTPSSVSPGDEMYMRGYPFDSPEAVTYRGPVSAKFPLRQAILGGKPVVADAIHVQMPVASGFSGGPLVSFDGDKVIGVITTKLGGISPKLRQIREGILQAKTNPYVRSKLTFAGGLDPHETILELINVLDLYLSAGAGWAISVDHIHTLLKSHGIETYP